MKAMMEMYQNAYRAMPSPMNPFEFLARRRSAARRRTPLRRRPAEMRRIGSVAPARESRNRNEAARK